MKHLLYSILNKSSGKNIVWECLKCGMPNFSTTLFDTTASLEAHNRFDFLSSLSDPESLIPEIIAPPPPPPTAVSSPIVLESKEAKGKAALSHPLRILIMNCQSIRNNKAELRSIIDSTKPDIILGNDSWLPPDIKTWKVFPTPLVQFWKTEQYPWWCLYCF